MKSVTWRGLSPCWHCISACTATDGNHHVDKERVDMASRYDEDLAECPVVCHRVQNRQESRQREPPRARWVGGA